MDVLILVLLIYGVKFFLLRMCKVYILTYKAEYDKMTHQSEFEVMRKWQPLQPAMVDHQSYHAPRNRYYVEETMRAYGCTFDEGAAMLERYDQECTYWRNDLYQVQVRKFYNEQFKEEMLHLNIRRIDGAPVFDWRHRQLIKNQLAGEECEAFEVYPAESRLSDTSNKYHLFAFVNPAVRLPVKVNAEDVRDVVEHEVRSPPGARQRRILK